MEKRAVISREDTPPEDSQPKSKQADCSDLEKHATKRFSEKIAEEAKVGKNQQNKP